MDILLVKIAAITLLISSFRKKIHVIFCMKIFCMKNVRFATGSSQGVTIFQKFLAEMCDSACGELSELSKLPLSQLPEEKFSAKKYFSEEQKFLVLRKQSVANQARGKSKFCIPPRPNEGPIGIG